MPEIDPLCESYTEARAGFLEAAASAGARQHTTLHPARGPAGESLSLDIAELGPEDSRTVVLIVSGTHGVEGFAGSALQRHWLAHHASERPEDVRVVLLHAFNPCGFAWVRRVNEDNVDLNRNFVDWSVPPPRNRGYDELADLLVPPTWTQEVQRNTTGALLEKAGEMGLPKLQAVVSGGQYHHPTGVFYGGEGPTWSHRFLESLCAESLRGVSQLGVIDLHTGLGPWSYGELISHAQTDSSDYRRAASWWGDVRSMVDGDSVSAALSGDWLARVGDWLPAAEIASVALEYGTVDTVSVLQALRADAWLHAHGDPRGSDAVAVQAGIRAAFADDDPAWLRALWPRFAEVMGAALQNVQG